jgi:D-sedoheptulose 7-phosphate isomerase
MSHVKTFLAQTAEIAGLIDAAAVEELANALRQLRERGGRLFLLGVGGSAANCSHAVNDFRKICGIEAYAPVDNVSELTARTNDEGWETVFSEWLKISKANKTDAIFVLSVGGGNAEKNVSANLVKAIDEAKERGLEVFGIVSRDGGHTKKKGDHVIVIPSVDPAFVTPHAEAYQAILWHCLVCHPLLSVIEAKWESLGTK